MRSASAYGVFLALTLFRAQTAAAKDNSCQTIAHRPAAIVGFDFRHLKAWVWDMLPGTGPARFGPSERFRSDGQSA